MSIEFRSRARRWAASLLLLAAGAAQAAPVSFAGDRAGFIAATSPSDVTLVADAPGRPLSGAPRTVSNPVANLTFTSLSNDAGCSTSPCALVFGDFNARMPGVEFGMSGQEDFRLTTSRPVHAMGFDIYDPSYTRQPGNAGCNTTVCGTNDLFRFSIYNGSTLLATFDYVPPDDDGSLAVAPYGFFGVASDVAFTRIDVNDLSGRSANEYFANFLLGGTAPVAGGSGVPEPSSLALTAAALWALAAATTRGRRRP